MANLDSSVAQVIDRKGLESDEDDLIAELEHDDDLGGLRERRLQQLHQEYTRAKSLRNQEHGAYAEIKDEKTLMDLTTSTKLCVVHFGKADFNRCRIMDGHLENLAPKHYDTRFVKIDVTNAPFLVVKLKVQVLPCVLVFIDGVSKDRIVGFEGIGRGTDNFTTRELEVRLFDAGVLLRTTTFDPKASTQAAAEQRAIRDSKKYDDDDDDDWD